MTQVVGADIGRRIAHYRKLNGWSAEKLAEEAGGGLTRSVIANIESGRRDDVGVRDLVAISVALQVPPAALLVDIERPSEPTSVLLGHPKEEGGEPTPFNTRDAMLWLGGIDVEYSKDWPPARRRAHQVVHTTGELLRHMANARAYERSIFNWAGTPGGREQIDRMGEVMRHTQDDIARLRAQLEELGVEVGD
jgi:transcriptional regulator with XRE-family HTH domain